jgi:NAD(P)-dependent dehydrogenase (short-subunit alcohol dehydrogenase family)
VRGLKGKRCLISGGSSGIGLATAKRFLEEGARVVIAGLGAEDVDGAVAELSSVGPVRGFAGDVSRETDVATIVSAAIDTLGGLDILINNAGVAWREDFLEITAANWDKMIAVNLRGMFLVAQAVARQMVHQGTGGSIANMSSTNGLGGEEKFTHYNASKAGVILLSKTMAVELGRYGIRVNSVCPGSIRTNIIKHADPGVMEAYARDKIPLGRRGLPLEVAAAYAFLASDEASFISGCDLVVDGGQLAVM